ncbi:regulatory signaling modulator protein AmpE [Marinospirillum alkaliphilum]|uniref:AmpE protein n=1 Tax=Marinospirillum alkaliphilum DSM 21637 TaxID=1122209 RepID=A0A1K1VF64_9GAMM|nr:regulatory signaling modulator protein AmpE [Marinospirillum alkaliphilum]SFX23355.1 AmpE protein [Marinospirillum alkaliphilum DSM 21637]
MKFFVMLAVLLLRSVPGQGLTRPVDRWLLSWQHRLSGWLGQAAGSSAVFLLTVLPPVLLLWLLLWWLDGVLWSLPVLLVHLVVIFYALGRRNDLVWVERYMIAWRQGDHQAASYYAAEILDEPLDAASATELHCRVVSRLVFFAFDRLFLVLFWYLLLGPVGALLARLSEQAIANARRGRRVLEEEGIQDPLWPGSCEEQVERFQRVMEWPAARLMGLTLALTGRPLLGLRQFLSDLPRWQLSSEVFLNRQLLSGYGQLSGEDLAGASAYCERPELMTEEADQELSLLRERVWRSLAVWVAVTAVGVIFWT